MGAQNQNPLTTLFLLFGIIVLLIVVIRWLTIGYSPQRIDDVACRAAAHILQEAESSGKPLSPTLKNLRKKLDSPRVRYQGLPFKLVSHKEHGFDKIYLGPPEISYFKGGIVVLNGKEVPIEKLPKTIREPIERSMQQLKDSGATPYTEESRIQGFLEALRRAQEKNIALVIYSPTRNDLLDLAKKTIKAAGNEKFPGVPIIVVTDYVHPLQLDSLSRELQVSTYPISYKMSWEDLIFW